MPERGLWIPCAHTHVYMDEHTHASTCMHVQCSHKWKGKKDKVKHSIVDKNIIARDHQYLVLYLWQKE